MKLALTTCLATLLSTAAWAEITITDLRDRTVTLDAPAERVLLGFYYEDYLAVAGDGAVDKIVGLSRGPWADWRPKQWQAYTQTFPQLADLPDVGDTESSTFSIEAALATDPDLVILAGWQYDALGESAQQFGTAGVPVLVLDYNAQTLEAHLASTRALGQAMGTEDRAEALATLYADMTADTAARVEASTESPKVYVELAQKGPDEVGNSYAGGMWGGVIDRLKGQNIANGQIENWGPLSPEYVLSEAPEVILLSGSEWLNRPASVPMGFGADRAWPRPASTPTRPARAGPICPPCRMARSTGSITVGRAPCRISPISAFSAKPCTRRPSLMSTRRPSWNSSTPTGCRSRRMALS